MAKTTELLGHRIFLRSVVVRGSVFAIEVPLAEGRGQMEQPDSPEVTNADRSATILVIEDDQMQASAQKIYLCVFGYQVVIARDVVSASMALTRPPDVIISDYRLPGNQMGVEAVLSVRMAHARVIPAIIMTGDTQAEIALEAAQADCEIVHKPCSPKVLLDRLARLVPVPTSHG